MNEPISEKIFYKVFPHDDIGTLSYTIHLDNLPIANIRTNYSRKVDTGEFFNTYGMQTGIIRNVFETMGGSLVISLYGWPQ